MVGKLSVVVGGQYGSEGKGAVAGRLARDSQLPVVAVRVAGPNAGHTVYGNCPPGCEQDHRLNDLANAELTHPWKLRQVPVAAVTRADALLVIAAGSEIDPQVLEAEVSALDAAGYRASSRLIVDRQATIIEPEDRAAESAVLVARIGSTGKGIGAARANRAMRTAKTVGTRTWSVPDTAAELNRDLAAGYHIIIEGTQGYALGLHAGLYPYCTSSDCRAIDFLAMAGVNPWTADPDIWVVLRTLPIRVAGSSGPMLAETTWENLGLPVERTTVTNKIRRVGKWDPGLAAAAVTANGGRHCKIALTMFDYLMPQIAGQDGRYADWTSRNGLTSDPVDPVVTAEKLLAQFEADCGAPIRLVGTGPDTMLER